MSISPISGGSSDWYSSQSTQNQQPPELNLTDTAQLLGISTTQLDSDLQSGQTLSSLAQTAGVSSSDLLSAVESDLSANAPQGAPTLSSDQLQQFATAVIDGTGPNVGWQGDTGSAYGSDGASGSANSGDLYDNYS